MDLQIDGNTALVTASSSGLGKASAKALAREGADVIINGRDMERLETAKAEIGDVPSGNVVIQESDLTNEGDTRTLVETTIDEFGGIDHLVTSTGDPPSRPFSETSDEDWYQA